MKLPLVKLPLAPKWLPPRWLALKYGLGRRSLKKWIEGQGTDCYRLTMIRTPGGLRILDPQLEFPPHRTAPPGQLYIFKAREVAVLIGVTKRAVNMMARAGRIRYKLYGTQRFFPLSEVRRLLKERGQLSESGLWELASRLFCRNSDTA